MPIEGTPGHHLLSSILVTPLVTLIVTYAISLSTGAMKYPMFFISTSIEAKPASCVGTFGLSFTSLLSPLVAFIRRSFIEEKIEEEYADATADATSDSDIKKKALAMKINNKAFRVAVWAGFGGHGVASFQSIVDDCNPLKYLVIIHLIFATIFFGNGAFYSYFSMRLDDLLPNVGTPNERFFRKLFAWGTFAQFCTVCVVFPIIVIVWGSTDVLTLLVALLEVSMLCTFMSTYVTFYNEFKFLHFKMLIMKKDQRYSINARDNSSLQLTPTNSQKKTVV